ncbi:asparagine synthase-related protein [Halorussus litoreus]|uniref:asparagine synthase-related protein n=1 Tax=Halorussus litoreus TaxID=1710536 RepID=UPI000E275439|nr:asparagine synthase-related protein [Halorussus litoreus]
MSGVAGGRLDRAATRAMIDEVAGPGDDAADVFGSGEFSLGVTGPTADSHGVTTWDDGKRAGVVYGAITNLPELSASHADVFESLFDDPAGTAARLEGGFLIAAYDSEEDRQLLVTDKIGARQCYVITEGDLRYSTSVAALVPRMDDVRVDRQSVSDVLLLGSTWGNRTLVDGVRAIRPAMVLEAVDGERSATRYWKPSYREMRPNEAYISGLVDRYRQTVRRVSRTLPSEAGIWLSGGLDSRTTAAALIETIAGRDSDPAAEFRTLGAYTYDANPPTNDNPKIAAQIAEKLGVELTDVPLSAETFGGNFERAIDAVDGMVRWNTVANLSATYGVDPLPPVMMEGMQGELVGDHLLRPHLTNVTSPVESQYLSEATTSVDRVSELLVPDVDPLATLREEVEATGETDVRKQILDVHFRNYYSRKTLTSNRVMRDFVGTRTPHADGDYLEWCSRLPSRFRKGAVPFTRGSIPYETTRAKLALCRRITPDLADVTYERTKLDPSMPYPLHVAGFFANVLVGRLRSKPTYGGPQLADFWIRNRESRVHERVVDLLDDASRRALFDADAVREVFDEHMHGANNGGLIAQITTLEHWIQNHVDGRR